MSLTFAINQHAIGLVHDQGLGKHLGTGFSFVRPTWFVTARHVVLEHGEPRRQLIVLPNKHDAVRARVLYVHPEVDLAVLELERPVCPQPLFPAHHALTAANGLVFAGYAPSKKQPSGAASIYVNQIVQFDVEVRGRNGYDEETIIFDAPDSEGGHSGGPILGAGGGVVGAIIEHFHTEQRLRARGTSLMPLVTRLSFERDG